jgi:predicted MFS family arabinose efflux permease
MVRSRWSRLLADTALVDAAFSLEGIADELIFITGPVLVVALAAGLSPVAAVLVTAALSVAGVAGLTRQRRSEPPATPVTRLYGPALRSPALRVLITMTVCLGAMFVAVDLATIAFAQHHGDKAAAGPLLGLYGLGSAVAGVWYGARRWKSSHASRLTAALAVTVAGVAPLAFMPGIWPMALAITTAGLGISATLACSYRVADMALLPGQRTEAMSWLSTAAATGTAVGAPFAGRLIDAAGAPAGYLFAFGAGLAAVTIVASRRRCLTLTPQPAIQAGGRGGSSERFAAVPARHVARSSRQASHPGAGAVLHRHAQDTGFPRTVDDIG